MVQFSRLRLSGFKSFVDPTELYIEPGLTGIIGPNGCGKSNLVEALRWVMGETSAKQMRGGEMDDVIFAGTVNRPARNISEVMLSIDNSDRDMPAQFNDAEELNVARRIERGSGSNYSVNGQEVRARDVQTLFADAATGARSPALVSQGRIGAIINAKPSDRRMLLEEAAGIMGLHARRHEAELRLRAAESNLERLDDVLGAMEEQFKALKRQARQATRYRNLSDHIRHAEAVVLYHYWTEAVTARDAAGEALRQAEDVVGEITREVAVASTEQAEAAAAVPGLRQAEAEAAAVLQRLLVARDALEAEEKRLAEMRDDLRARIAQIDGDVERERGLGNDAREAVDRLDAEAADIRAAQVNEETEIEDARRVVSEREAAAAELEHAVTEAAQSVAADTAREAALTRQIADQEQRRNRLTDRLKEIAAQLERAEADAADRVALNAAREKAVEAREALETAREALQQAEQLRGDAQKAESEARDAVQEKSAATAKLRAEEEALAKVLDHGTSGEWPPLIDAVEVEPGYEPALGAALGEDLTAPSDENSPIHWRTLPPYESTPALPDGVEPLAQYVKAHPALSRRLSQIGVVEDDADGAALSRQLAQGQRLVSKSGNLWRWDGFTTAASAPTPAARRLEQRNRLIEVRAERGRAETAEAAAAMRHGEFRAKAEAAVAAERAGRDSVWAADRAFQEARDAETKATQKAADAQSRLLSLTDGRERAQVDLAELDGAIDAARREAADFADLPGRREALEVKRRELIERRSTLSDSRSALDRLVRDAEARHARLESIAADLESWQTRAANADAQIDQLIARKESVREELARLDEKPAEIAQKRAALFAQIDDAEAKRKHAADTLAEAETRLEQAGRDLRAKEARLGEAREERIRREAALEQSRQSLSTVGERIRERLKCSPETVLDAAEIPEGKEIPPLDATEIKLEKLIRERDNMGPVNLRAEIEAAELDERITSTQAEREDLVAAIAKLRQGISGLNREGRERLLIAFKQVDAHFQELFTRMFGGGRAHLAMTESDDPLDAGLEIMASPPGKKLQSMSLLSGGEQALTAIALLFAVFITNPAPICVLDEVDAPLDDNNVDRFCTLLEDMVEKSSTRFLLITHHRLTMARMDRLYGVTMAEQGVSQLVSVDLQTAERMRESA